MSIHVITHIRHEPSGRVCLWFYGVRVGNREVSGGAMRWKRPGIADDLGLAEPRQRGAWNELLKNGIPQIDNYSGGDSVNLPFLLGLPSGGISLNLL